MDRRTDTRRPSGSWAKRPPTSYRQQHQPADEWRDNGRLKHGYDHQEMPSSRLGNDRPDPLLKLQQENKRLLSELAGMKNIAEMDNIRIKQLEESSTTAEEEVKTRDRLLDKFYLRLNTSEETKKTDDEEKARLQEKVSELTEQLKNSAKPDVQCEYKQLSHDFDCAKDAWQKEKKKLFILTRREKEVYALRNNLKRSQEQMERLTEELCCANNKTAQLQTKVDLLQQDNERQRSELSKVEKIGEFKDHQINQLEERVKTQEQEMETQRNLLEEHSLKLKAVSEMRKKEEEENTRLQEKTEDLTEQLKNAAEQLVQSNQAWELKYNVLEDNLTLKEARINLLTDEHEKLSDGKQETDKEMEVQRNLLEELSLKMNTVSEMRKKEEEENARLQEKTEDLTEQLKNAAEQLVQSNHAWELKYNVLEDDLTLKEARINVSLDANNNLCDGKQEMDREMEVQRNLLEELSLKMKTVSEMKKMGDPLLKLQQENKRLLSELAGMKNMAEMDNIRIKQLEESSTTAEEEVKTRDRLLNKFFLRLNTSEETKKTDDEEKARLQEKVSELTEQLKNSAKPDVQPDVQCEYKQLSHDFDCAKDAWQKEKKKLFILTRREKEVYALRNNLKRSQEQMERLTEELCTQKKRSDKSSISKFSTELNCANNKTAQLQTKVDLLQQDNERQRSELSKVEKIGEFKDHQINQLEERVKTQEQEMETQRNLLEEHSLKLKAVSEMRKKEEEENTRLQEKTEDLTEQLKNAAEQLVQSNQAWELKYNVLEDNLTLKEARINLLTDEHEKLSDGKQETDKEMEVQRNLLEELSLKMNTVSEMRKKEEEENARLQEKTEDLTEQLKNAAEQLVQSNHAWELKYNVLEDDLTLKEARINVLLDANNNLCDGKQEMDREMEVQRNLLEELSLKMKTVSEMKKKEEEENTRLQEKTEDLTEQLKNAAEQLVQSNQAWELKYNVLEDNLTLKEARINLLTDEHEKLSDGKQETDKEMEVQRNLLEELSLKMKTVSEMKKMDEEENARLQNQTEDLTEQLENSARQLLQSNHAWELKYSILEDDLTLKEARINVLLDANNNLCDGKQEMDREMEVQRNLLEELSLKMKTVSEMKKMGEEENTRLQEKTEDLTEQLKNAAEQLVQSNQAWELKYNVLEDNLTLKEARINLLTDEHEKLSDGKQETDKEMEVQRNLLEELSLKMNTVSEMRKKEEEENARLQEKTEDLTEQLKNAAEQLVQSNHAWELKYNVLEDDLTLKEARINVLLDANNNLCDGKQEMDREMEVQRNLLEELSLKMKTVSEMKKMGEEENARLQNQTEDLTEQLENAAEQLVQSNQAWQLKYSILEKKVQKELALKEKDKEQKPHDEKEHLVCGHTQEDKTSKRLKKESKKKEKEEEKQQHKEKKKGFWSWMGSKERKHENKV